MASENWVNITGYEGKYMASESGLIKSCERHVKHSKVNLRYCSQRENLGRLTTSTGVSLNSDRYKKRYRARIRVKGKMIDLGSYHTKEEAAKSYQNAKNKYE